MPRRSLATDFLKASLYFPMFLHVGHAEVRRLIPPDRRPETLSFHLGRMLQGDKEQDLLLQNQDRVIVFARANLKETPRVSINGEVQSPGWYPLAEKMRVRNLVFQAGNVKRSAYLPEAEITRLNKSGLEVTSRRLKINLEEAIRGNPEHNLLLEEDDQLFVRQIPKWFVDRTVVLDGEVRFPGAYTFYKGERLSSVLQRAGGFTGEAYLPAAIFTRESVRKVQEKRIQEFIEEQQQELVKEGARALEGAVSKEEIERRQQTLAQKRELIARLKAAKVTVRIVINLTSPERGTKGDLLFVCQREIPPTPLFARGEYYRRIASLYLYSPAGGGDKGEGGFLGFPLASILSP